MIYRSHGAYRLGLAIKRWLALIYICEITQRSHKPDLNKVGTFLSVLEKRKVKCINK